ncbi:MAG: hypothetical protein HXY29_14600 [Rhodocyclaceae bacterium]|nr:hypothetical protein [Rhodocyclaceae bacterium]
MLGGEGRDAIPARIEREMAASVAEFEHGLRLGAPGEVSVLGDGHYRVVHEGVTLDIHIRLHGQRCLGALAIGLLWVVYEFHGGEPQARRALLTRLDVAMLRGGG